MDTRLETMVRIYGIAGGVIRIGGLAILHHTVSANEFYADGVAVAPEMRCEGVGTHLFELLEQAASKKQIRTISLEVIDTNPRAKALYEKIGFMAVSMRTIWPLNLFKTATLMVKTID